MQLLESTIHPNMVKVWKVYALIGAGVLAKVSDEGV